MFCSYTGWLSCGSVDAGCPHNLGTKQPSGVKRSQRWLWFNRASTAVPIFVAVLITEFSLPAERTGTAFCAIVC